MYVLQMLRVQCVKVDRRQKQLWKATFCHEIGNDFPGIREKNVGAETADHRSHFLVVKAIQGKDACLIDFNKISCRATAFNGDGDSKRYFIKRVFQRLDMSAEVKVDGRLPFLNEHVR